MISTLICDQFKKDTATNKDDNDSVAISSISSSDLSSRDANRQDPSYIYFKWLSHGIKGTNEIRYDRFL